MTSATPAKFNFDLDLTKSADKKKLIGERELEQMLKTAEQNAYANGFAKGEASEASKASQAISAAAVQLAGKTIELTQIADAAQKQNMADAARLAIQTGKKLAANLIERQPLVELETLMSECLTTLDDVPHLVIRCNQDLANAVRDLAEEKMKASNFSGRLVVMGEPDIRLGDVRFEWVEGGLVRDIEKMSDQIDQKLSSFLSASAGPSAASTQSGAVENGTESNP